jgi:RNA polymerase sigma-70 factor, ECF subfamily
VADGGNRRKRAMPVDNAGVPLGQMSSSVLVRELPEPPQPALAGAAAGRLYETYHERVYGYCLYFLGNREEAEDATQTTFLQALRALERGVVPQTEANWLFTIARNSCRSRVRTRGVARERELVSDPQVLQRVAPGRDVSGEELFGLEDALASMPELQRRAIILREWRGCSYREIAEELDLTPAAVETLIFRARRSLAERLEHPQYARRQVSALGAFLGFFKSLFGLGSAKVGVAVATMGALAIGFGGLPSDVEQRPAVAPSAPAKAAPVTTTGTAVAPSVDPAGPDRGAKVPRPTKPAKPAKKPGVELPGGVPVDPKTGDPVEQVGSTVENVVGGVTGTVNDTVDTVDDTVDDVTDDVNDVVDDVNDATEGTLPPLPPVPDVLP